MADTSLIDTSGGGFGISVLHVPTAWLNDDEMRAWRSYVETTIDLNNAIERDLAEHGLTLGDYQVLVYLSEAPERQMKMRDLAELLQLSPSGLTRRLDGLVSSGHVERRTSAADGRVMMAVLTDSGLEHLGHTAPHHVASVRQHLIDRLDPTLVTAMGDIFEAVADGLSAAASDERSAAVTPS
ncbi:MAG: MarR family transcriptional regulator [Actinomycetota bacterium]